MEARGENSEPEKRDLDQIIEDLKQTPIFMDEITEDAARNNPAVCALLELMKDSSPEGTIIWDLWAHQ